MRQTAKLLPLCGALALCGPALASPTERFEVTTAEQLDRGEPRGTFISSDGEVAVGRGSRRLKSAPYALLWSSVRDARGAVYFGTGGEAHLLQASGDTPRRVADLQGLLVTALAAGPGGKLLAGVMPGAKIVEVDPASGKWRQLAHLPAEHIWALLYDARQRRIYAASGAPGKIFTLPAGGGTPTVYYDPEEQHLLCLARAKDGALLAGSADKAILYRVTARDRATALADFSASELQDVEVARDGTLYLAVNAFQPKDSGLPRFDRQEKCEGGTPIRLPKEKKKEPEKVRPSELRPGAKEGKGAVFRLSPDGTLEQLLALDKGYFTNLQLDPDGALWAAEGAEGRVFLVREDRTVLKALDLPERQALALAVGGREQYLGTGDAGALYRILPGPAKDAAYVSEALDAQHPARWGNLRYEASGPLAVSSRSGQTAKPDKTWTPFAAARPVAERVVRLTSPPGRYLQVRLAWPRGGGARLRSFVSYYLPQNQRARVTEVTAEPAQGDKDKPRLPRITLRWKVENPDKDQLVYRVHAREELGQQWRLISGKDPLEKAELEWNTESVPDGHYRVRISASDERANGPELTLVDERVSDRVLVDNRRPQVVGLAVGSREVSGEARDSFSIIRRVEVAVDDEPWRLIAPTDGIYDSPTEPFRFPLPAGLASGPHVLAVRATDEAGNVGVAQVNLRPR